MRHAVIGLGETGRPLYNILKEAFCLSFGYDPKHGLLGEESTPDFLNICIPYSGNFFEVVSEYQEKYNPRVTVIHSTVPIGTTSKIKNAVHSPILGRHDAMEDDMKKYEKWVGGPLATEVWPYFEVAGMPTHAVETSEETEALKLMCLAKYGVSIAFSKYQKEICDKYSIPYEDVMQWDMSYNLHVRNGLQRPLIYPKDGLIGGHCVTQNTKLLNEQHPNQMLDEVLKYA